MHKNAIRITRFLRISIIDTDFKTVYVFFNNHFVLFKSVLVYLVIKRHTTCLFSYGKYFKEGQYYEKKSF